MYRTLHEAAAAVRSRRTAPTELVEACLAAVDAREDRIRAWVFVDREGARREALALGVELEQGQYRGPLHGIPLGVKDIFDVFDWPTAAGSALWSRSIARQDAETVARLRQAGAVFLGKTVTTQYASFDPPVTRNPWNTNHTPGGSSSGSAAALAAGMCLGAIGSQTGGSITRPAAYCGVCGFKPAYGAVPLSGIVPLASSMDHPGPMARSVLDLHLLYRVLADPALEPLEEKPAAPQQLALVRGIFQDLAQPIVLQSLAETVQRLAQAGARITEAVLPAGFAQVLTRHRTVMAVEAAQFHRVRLERHPDDYGPNIRRLLEEGLRTPAPEYADCKVHQAALRRETLGLLSGGTILLAPATTGPAPDASTTGNPAFNSPWSYTGLPAVNFPTGQFADGLPLGIQLIGHPGRIAELFAAARWCEQVLCPEPLELPAD